MKRRVITMTACDRPHYLRRTLGALSAAVGIEKYRIIVCVEPGCEETVRLARSATFCPVTVVVNETRLSCPVNTYKALSMGFVESDFVIHVEDDILLWRDALLFFEHCREAYRNDPDVLTVSAYNAQECGNGHHHALARREWFTPWAFATWRDRFEEMKPEWDFDYSHGNWDNNINRRIRARRREVFPVLARAQNIGLTGAHVPSEEWAKVFHHNPFWAGTARPRVPGAWREDQNWRWSPPEVTPEILARFPRAWLKAAEYID